MKSDEERASAVLAGALAVSTARERAAINAWADMFSAIAYATGKEFAPPDDPAKRLAWLAAWFEGEKLRMKAEART